MSSPLKGAIALGAAGLLLLGGAGTYALWNDTINLNGGSITSGQLKFVNPTPGVWADASTGTPVTIPNITAFKIVPGDILTYTLSTTLRAQGNNLQATIAADPSSVTGDSPLRQDVAVTTAVTVGGAPLTTITAANDNQTVQVKVTLDFDDLSTNASQLENLNLSALQLTVQQNPR